MIVSVLLPYNARYHKNTGTHLWFFYKQLEVFSSLLDDVTFIGWKGNFADPAALTPDSWEKQEKNQKSLEFSIPDEKLFRKAKIIATDQKIFAPLEDELKSNNLVWIHLISREYPPFCEYLRGVFKKLGQKDKIEAVILTCNLPSLETVCRELNIPVIHYEVGPLRKEQYLQTAYWDLSGVNGNTEAERRFSESAESLAEFDLSRQELQALLLEKDFWYLIDSPSTAPDFKIGVAGQVEDDSNILAYSKGFDNLELVKYAQFHFGPENILFRSHPWGQTVFSGNFDCSSSPFEFFSRINGLLTINSSMALEACLWGTPVMVMGDSPFCILSEDLTVPGKKQADRIRELNFLCLNYIIPYEFLFDYEYCRWRLSQPGEIEIRKKHIEYYCRKKGVSDIVELKKLLASGAKSPDVPGENRDVLKINVRDISGIIQFEKKLTAEKAAGESLIMQLSDKLVSEIEYYQKLVAYLQEEVKNYRSAYEYNEGEAKRLAGVLEEVQGRLNLLNGKLQDKETETGVLAEKLRQVQNLSDLLRTQGDRFRSANRFHRRRMLELEREQKIILRHLAAEEEKAEKKVLLERQSHLLLRWALRLDDLWSGAKKFFISSKKTDSEEAEK